MKYSKPLVVLLLNFLAAFDALGQATQPNASTRLSSSSGADGFMIFWAIGFIVILGMVFFKYLGVEEKRSQDYNWYKAKHPTLVTGGRVCCHTCKSSNIGTERLMTKTDLRAQVCRPCGTALYYSKEA